MLESFQRQQEMKRLMAISSRFSCQSRRMAVTKAAKLLKK